MKSLQKMLALLLLSMLGHACASAPPTPPPPEAGPTAMAAWTQTAVAPVPIDPTILKQPSIQALIKRLVDQGLAVAVDEGMRPEVGPLGVRLRGLSLKVDGDHVAVYWYPTQPAANLGVNYFKAWQANIMDPPPNLRFHLCDQLIVSYAGTRTKLIAALEERCGAPFLKVG